jgi:hypothetical protein
VNRRLSDVHTDVPRDYLCRFSLNSRLFFVFLFHTAKIENTERCLEIYSVSSPVCVLATAVKAFGGRDFVCDLNN